MLRGRRSLWDISMKELSYGDINDMYWNSLPGKVFAGSVFLDVCVSELCVAGAGGTSNPVLD